MPAPVADPLAPWLAEQLGMQLRCRVPVGGGCSHRAWRLELMADSGKPAALFAKTSPATSLPMLQAEADGLDALATCALDAGPAAPLVPQPLLSAVVADEAVLLLPWINVAPPVGDARSVAAAWMAMGRSLAALHQASAGPEAAQRFGWSHDNFIGTSPQFNGWLPAWSCFFLQRRLEPQLAWARNAGLPDRRVTALRMRATQLLEDHAPLPALVHGDLWSGNAGFDADQRPILFDPAVYWGDREVDLAMARLFGGFPEAFFAGYQALWPLPAGFAQRMDLYNLYHLLNHLNLFGSTYRHQVESCIERLLQKRA